MSAFFCRIWRKRRVFIHSVLGGRCIVHLLKFADVLNRFQGHYMLMFEYDLFLKSHWMFSDLDRHCFGNWMHTICHIIQHYQFTPLMWDSHNHPVSTALERKRKRTDASFLFENESTGGVCFFLSSLNQRHNKTFRGSFLGVRGHTRMSTKWSQRLAFTWAFKAYCQHAHQSSTSLVRKKNQERADTGSTKTHASSWILFFTRGKLNNSSRWSVISLDRVYALSCLVPKSSACELPVGNPAGVCTLA